MRPPAFLTCFAAIAFVIACSSSGSGSGHVCRTSSNLARNYQQRQLDPQELRFEVEALSGKADTAHVSAALSNLMLEAMLASDREFSRQNVERAFLQMSTACVEDGFLKAASLLGSTNFTPTPPASTATNRVPPTQVSSSALKWGSFASHPARTLLDASPSVEYIDAKMLAIDMLGGNFDLIADLGYFNLMPEWFVSYRAADEFQRREMKPDLRDKYNARLNELKAAEYLLDVYKHPSIALGEYSFERQAFALEDVNVVSWVIHAARYANARDTRVFPREIHVEEARAEGLATKARTSASQRSVTLYILFRPTTAHGYVSANQIQLSNGPLEGNVSFVVAVLQDTGEVLGVYPNTGH